MLTANKIHEFLKRHTFSDLSNIIIDHNRSKGLWAVDLSNGKKYFDCTSLFNTAPIGFNHHLLVYEENDKFNGVSYLQSPTKGVYTCWYADFIETFVKKAAPENFNHIVCGSNIDDAIDSALKLSFHYTSQRLKLKPSFTKSLDVIYFAESYHGNSPYALSVSDVKNYSGPLFNWTKVNNPKVDFCNNDSIEKSEEITLSQIKDALSKGNVASIIVEPIQDEGGNNLFRGDFLQELRKLANESKALLIFDESKIGFGPSGSWWCFERFGVTPDIIIFGGRTQVAGLLLHDKLAETKEEFFKINRKDICLSLNNSIPDMVRSMVYLKVIEKEDLVKKAKKVGEYFLAKLRELEAVSAQVKNTRGVGTLLAFDLPDKIKREKVLKKLQENLLIQGCGEKSIKFRPALTFGKEDADLLLDYVKKAL